MNITIATGLFAGHSTFAGATFADTQDQSSSWRKHARWFIGVLSALLILIPVMVAAAPAAPRKSKTLPAVARWYLLAPPFVRDAPGLRLQLQTPLNRWVAMDSAETIEDCQEQRDNMMRMYRSADISSSAVQIKLLMYHYTVCVSSADPQLTTYRFNAFQAAGDALFRDAEAGHHSFAGPFLDGAGFSDDAHGLSDKGCENKSMSVPTMLSGIAIMAIIGSLCGWLLEPCPNKRSYVRIEDRPNEIEPLHAVRKAA